MTKINFIASNLLSIFYNSSYLVLFSAVLINIINTLIHYKIVFLFDRSIIAY